MTPLEDYLTKRPFQTSRWNGLQAAVAGISPPLARWMDRRMWPRSMRHMRSFAWGITFQREKDGSWVLLENGQPSAHSILLRDVVGQISRPVTIVASGPSSKEMDWERIRSENRYMIAVNGATSVVADYSLKPDLHVVVDRHFTMAGDKHFRNFPELPLVCTPRVASIVAARTPGIFNRKPFAIIERANEWHGLPNLEVARLRELNATSGSPLHFADGDDMKCTVGWSHDPALAIFSGCTVVVSALQVAVGMGATDIEIIGMDLSNACRAYQEGDSPVANQLEKNYSSYILPTFELIQRALTGSGVKIKNLSPVCPLADYLFEFQTVPGR